MSTGQEFLIVAAGYGDKHEAKQYVITKETLQKDMTAHPLLNPPKGKGDDISGPCVFNVPVPDKISTAGTFDKSSTLTFGSFDNLVRLMDDLAKADQQLDSVVHRFERQYLDMDAKASFKVVSQRQEKTFVEYMKSWQWDEAKYPKGRLIGDNLTLLMSVVNKLDEEARNKIAQFNEAKTAQTNISQKTGLGLPTADLVDILTPQVVKMTAGGAPTDDFVYTEHLTTVCVIVPRGGDKDFEKDYSKFCELVVPDSAMKFKSLDDKDGNSLWRVIVFKTKVEDFKKACRERRLIPRDFEYSEDAHKKLVADRERLKESVATQQGRIIKLCQSSWSEAMIAWMHVKAMRVFVEGVLRFGMPPQFAAFTLAPKAGSLPKVRKALADVLGPKSKGASDSKNAQLEQAAAEDGEEYFPYVSTSFTPFVINR